MPPKIMNQATRVNLHRSAPLIFSLWEQQPRPELEPPYSTALELLDEISGAPRTIVQLVVALDLHHSTIREYMACLRSGGIAISVGTIRTRYQVTGRPEATYQLQPPDKK